MTDDPNRPAGSRSRDEAREAGSRLADDAKSSARSAMSQASGYANEKAHEARDGVAEEVSDVATALRKAAESTRGGSFQEQAFQMLAGSLADASDSLKSKEPGDLFAEVNRFARRNPVAFLGVAALAGFAISRVAGATARRGVTDHDPDFEDRYDMPGRSEPVPMAGQPRPAGVTPGGPGSASTGTAGTTGTAGSTGSARATPGTYETKSKGGL